MAVPKTYNELYVGIKRVLKNTGIENSDFEARELVCAAAGKTKEEFYRDMNQYSSPELEEKLIGFAVRRLKGEPLAYIVENWDFYGLRLSISKDVLIPRSDTEILAYAAIQAAKVIGSKARVLDLCTGSGCIGIAIASNIKGCRVVMTDISQEVLKIAKQNVRRYNLSYYVSCIELDALAAPPSMIGEYDIVVSNPPYIEHDEIETLDVSVKDYEPHTALDGGDDGLKFYRAITEKWVRVLREGGWMMFEVGEGQADAVRRMMLEQHMTNVNIIKDTAGIQRVVLGQKPIIDRENKESTNGN